MGADREPVAWPGGLRRRNRRGQPFVRRGRALPLPGRNDKRVIEPLKTAGKTVVIPSKANRSSPRAYDRYLYKTRHLIENFFAKLKQFRAIATRYDKTARNFLAAVYLAASAIWLN